MSAPHEVKRWTCPHCDYVLPAGDVGAQQWHMEQHREAERVLAQGEDRIRLGVDRGGQGDRTALTLLRVEENGDLTVLSQCFLDELPDGFSVALDPIPPGWQGPEVFRARTEEPLTAYSEEGAAGVKRDAGKPDLSFLPTEALVGAAQVFAFGAVKYARDNWRGGMPWTQPYAAVLRHLTAWLEGQDLDQDSGLPHLDHALCTLMMLRWFTVHRADLDNRFKGEAPDVDLARVKE